MTATVSAVIPTRDRAALVGRAPGSLGELLVRDQDTDLGVAEDVGDLRTRQVVVERCEIEAGLEGGEANGICVNIIRQE